MTNAGNPDLPANFRRLQAKSQTTPGAAPAKSIAVLPFVNLSADKNDEYLSDGMTEKLINALARLPGLSICSTVSHTRARNDIFPCAELLLLARGDDCFVAVPDQPAELVAA